MSEEKCVVDWEMECFHWEMECVLEKTERFGYLRRSSDGRWIFNDGSATSTRVVQGLVAAGLLEDREDGLFPGMSQSYSLNGKKR